ncbi:hypothetical protein [Aquibium sp. ELW1220]|uniref:hypothetical protein n=1 Tax=Aquibium sp. ELW1220 TaxID=2976766 RepID=UPI0025B22C54|nr:hypothetical protein [Aquibium sp. ELW1220]MDN2583927.1 hypothetical protein [Aquibium sp. ELW1220]
MNRREWERQAQSHARSAQSLIHTKHFDAAYHLAGLAVECALKSRIASMFRASDIPDKRLVNDVHTHDLSVLIRIAGLRDRLAAEQQINAQFDANWKTVATWSIDSRYRSWTQAEATALVNAVTERGTGVLSCIRRF